MLRLGCSSRPNTKYFFPHRTLLSPSPSKLGRQPCWVACLLVCVSGCPPRPLVPRGGDTLTRMRWGGGSHFGRRIIHSGTPRLKGPAGLSACCRVTIPVFFSVDTGSCGALAGPGAPPPLPRPLFFHHGTPGKKRILAQTLTCF